MGGSVSFAIWHSRQLSPTRRVAPSPTATVPELGAFPWGALRGVWMDSVAHLDPGRVDDLDRVLSDVAAGVLPRSRLGCRVQTDRVGLAKTTLRLHPDDTYTVTSSSGVISPQQLILGIVATVHEFPAAPRRVFVAALRAFTRGHAAVGGRLWACSVLGLDVHAAADPTAVKKAFRVKLKTVHPDSTRGGETAGVTVQQLAEAKRILLDETRPA